MTGTAALEFLAYTPNYESQKNRAWRFALLFLAPLPAGSGADVAAKVEGVVLDINDARIWNATRTFGNGVRDHSTKTRQDGTYSIELKPGTYTMEVKSYGFCTLRRSAFVLQKHTTAQFNLQMWVCPTDTEFIQCPEFEEVPHTNRLFCTGKKTCKVNYTGSEGLMPLMME